MGPILVSMVRPEAFGNSLTAVSFETVAKDVLAAPKDWEWFPAASSNICFPDEAGYFDFCGEGHPRWCHYYLAVGFRTDLLVAAHQHACL